MKAIDFYNRLLNYDNESKKTGKYYYGYSNGMVTIHRIGDNTEYVLYKNGNYIAIRPDLSTRYDGVINELKGDNFELYSKIQYFKCGYLKYDDTFNINDISTKMKLIFNNIEFFDEEENENNPILYDAMFIDRYSDGFSYSPNSKSPISIELCTIPYIWKENVNRIHYGAKCFPFIKKIRNHEAIYVKISSTARSGYIPSNVQEECNIALKELISYAEGAK